MCISSFEYYMTFLIPSFLSFNISEPFRFLTRFMLTLTWGNPRSRDHSPAPQKNSSCGKWLRVVIHYIHSTCIIKCYWVLNNEYCVLKARTKQLTKKRNKISRKHARLLGCMRAAGLPQQCRVLVMNTGWRIGLLGCRFHLCCLITSGLYASKQLGQMLITITRDNSLK